MKEYKFLRLVIFVNSFIPLVMLGWDVYHRQVGANPIEFVTRATGLLTLSFLLLSLLVTPVRLLTGQHWMGRHRRLLGLYAFFYACLHLLTYVWLDKFFMLGEIIADVKKRPFITVGMAAFLLLVPLAVTSTNKMIKRLGGHRWRQLHRLSYLAAIGGVLHFYLLVKADVQQPLLFALALALLLGFRVVWAYKNRLKRGPTGKPGLAPR